MVDFKEALRIAESAGYNVLSFNGEIYTKFKATNDWCYTAFTIDDFKC